MAIRNQELDNNRKTIFNLDRKGGPVRFARNADEVEATDQETVIYHVEDGTARKEMPDGTLSKPIRLFLSVVVTSEGLGVVPGKIGSPQKGTITLHQLAPFAAARPGMTEQIGKSISHERRRVRRSGS